LDDSGDFLLYLDRLLDDDFLLNDLLDDSRNHNFDRPLDDLLDDLRLASGDYGQSGRSAETG
jgi:hypothetical protein